MLTTVKKNQLIIELETIDGAILNELIEYLYSGRIVFQEENVAKFMLAASIYQFANLLEELVRYLRSNMSAKN